MTEAEWLASDDPAAMLAWAADETLLHPPGWQAVNGRKLRLFACACVRQVWHLLTGHYSREVVETIERQADGEDLGRKIAWGEVHDAVHQLGWLHACDVATGASRRCLALWDADQADLRRRQAALLRDIVGNPFRPAAMPKRPLRCTRCGGGNWLAVALRKDFHCRDCRADFDWPEDAYRCAWVTPTVVALAQSAYDERKRRCDRCEGVGDVWVGEGYPYAVCQDCKGKGVIDDGTLDPDRLGVLSDALEEAGCDDEGLLTHLRTRPTDEHSRRCGTAFRGCAPECPKDRWERSGPHVRGCWALDLILGKE